MDTRKIMISLVALFAVITVQAQERENMRTLIGNGEKLDHGGWGAPTAAYTRIMDQDAMLVGLKGGWMIDHRLTLGIAGYGLVTEVNNVERDLLLQEQGKPTRHPSRFQTGYGGLLIEPVIAYSSPVHVSLPIIIGAGGYSYFSHYDLDELESRPTHYDYEAQAYFVVEPGIELELNVIPLLRFSVGASYRYTSDLTMAATPVDAMRGMNATASIKVGKF